jgi:hypothetical protein
VSVLSDYTTEEQVLLRRSLRAAAVAVSAASPGRKEETVSEGYAAASLVLDSRPDYVGNTLVTSVIVEVEAELKADHPFPDYLKVASADGAGEKAMGTLRSVVALLDAKSAPDEAAGFKGWLSRIATAVAQAGKEDQGFLGMGGVAVNAAEIAILTEIAEVLGTDA